MKKLLLILTILFCLTGCSVEKKDELANNYKELNSIEEQSITHSYVGSYYKDSMGGIYGGHLINLYNDNTVKIHYAFYNWMMGGNTFDLYEGTYTLTNNLLNITYFAEGNTYDFSTEIVDKSFRGEILINMNFPDDESSDVKGLTYYEVQKTAITYSGEVFIGVTTTQSGYLAQILQLNYNSSLTEGEFELTVSNNHFDGKISGEYKVDKEVDFKYDILAVEENRISDIVLKNDNEDSFKYKGECVIESNFNIGYLTTQYFVSLVKIK